jgi:hypothetical protein
MANLETLLCPSCRASVSETDSQCESCGASLEIDSSPTPPVRNLTGTVLEGRYRVEEFLSKGGMGAVYRGADLSLSRPVAIKFLDARFLSDSSLVQRFQREALSAARLDHPNIIPIYSAGEHEGHAYMVMKFVDGATVSRLISERGQLSVRDTVAIVIQVCDGLAHMHRRGFVHRDIKPSNVMVDENGHAFVLDFGISRHETSNLTRTGLTTGTPDYMSPEQARESKSADGRSDIYSLGVMTFEMLAGRRPFLAESAFDLLMKHALERPPRLTDLAGLPPEIDDVLARALEKDPERRYESAKELRLALLERVLPAAGDLTAGERAQALLHKAPRPEVPLARPAVSSGDGTIPPASGVPTTAADLRRARQRAWKIAIPVTMILTAVLIAIFATWGGPERVAPPAPAALPVPPPVAPPTPPRSEPVQRRDPPPAVPAQGSLRIASLPAGARVRVDGHEVGVTPLLPLKVDVGSHEVTVEKSGHAPKRSTVQVEAGKAVPVIVKLRRLLGFVSIGIRFGTEPSFAEVLVDGKSIGTGPIADRKIAVGRHRLEIRRPGYAATPGSKTIEVKSGEHRTVVFDLHRL